jgi:glutamate-1-semialdehyde 2,1-aminomutase
MHFGDALTDAPTNFDEAKTTDEKMYAKVFHAMLDAGIAMAPGAYEALFVGLAHTDEVMEQLAHRTSVALGGLRN